MNLEDSHVDLNHNEVENVPVKHFTKVMRRENTGDNKGKTVEHFKCIYCDKEKLFQGPSSSSILKHLRKCHPKNCPELLPSTNQDVLKPMRSFLEPKMKRQVFDEDVFLGKIIKWIIKTDQPFSAIESVYFKDVLVYLDTKVTDHLCSRRTLMRRLEEVYQQQKEKLREKLRSFKSKYSITCDVWTSNNQLSFFGFTIHYIYSNWNFK
jgi:hypothetical protein